jgi:hypothetical protein
MGVLALPGEMAGRLGDDDDVDEVVEELQEADLAPLDDIAVGPGRLPEVAAERRSGRPGEGAPPCGSGIRAPRAHT